MADFNDLNSIPSPLKSELGSVKPTGSKKRGIGHQSSNGRLRLLPIDSSNNSAAHYEIGNQGNNSNNQSNGSNASTGSTISKIKKITQKRELMEAVRKANAPIILPLAVREPPGRDGVGSIARHESNGSSSASVTNDAAALEDQAARKDIEYLEDGVHTNARKFNDHKMMADKRQRELNSLLDELRTLQLETETLSRMQNHETPIAKQNERIRNEIQECTVSMEEQTHQRRQLEHMVRRLQTGQVKIDVHLQAMAKAVEASQQEADEVKLLCRQLEVGKSRAVQVLQDVQLQVQMDRKTRTRELNDHEVRARNAQKMEVWRLQRMQERAEMAAELRGDMSIEEEERLIRNIESRERANEALHLANLSKSQSAADYEEVLEQLKVAMGADSLHEVVEKVLAQASTNASLEKEKTQTEARVIAVRQDKEQCLQSLNELKASGIGGMELNREVYNALEKEIQQAKATLKINKAAYERLDGVIQSVRQGTFGLAQRLQAFDDALDWTNAEPALLAATSLTPTSMMSSSTSALQLGGSKIDSLVLAELKLTKMLELVGQPVSTVNGFGGFGNGTTNGNGTGLDGENEDGGLDETSTCLADYVDDRNTLWSPTINNDPVLHHNNIRVQPVMRRPETTHARHPFMMDFMEESGLDSARSTSSDTDPSTDVHVPSRDILKISSSRHCSEVKRKKEMAEKQKVATERGISDEEMMTKLKKQSQVEADTRLSTSPSKQIHSLMLPGSSTKDDVMSKSFAFVTQLHFNEIG